MKTATLICLLVIYGCVLTPTTEVKSCNRGHMAHRGENTYHLSLYIKGLLFTSGIHDSINESFWRTY